MNINTFGYIVTPKNSMLSRPDQKVSVSIRKGEAHIFSLAKEHTIIFVGKEAKKLDSSDKMSLYGVFMNTLAPWEKIYIDWKHAKHCA